MTVETRRLLWIYLGFVVVTVGVVIFFQVCSPPVRAQGAGRRLEWDSQSQQPNATRFHIMHRRPFLEASWDSWSITIPVADNCTTLTRSVRNQDGTRSPQPYYHCSYTVPDAEKDFFYSVAACNNAGCSTTLEEAALSCGLIGGSGCPCATWPSPPGCIP